MTADMLIDRIFREFSRARKARKLTNVRKHVNQAEYLMVELDEALQFENVDLQAIETDYEEEDGA